MSSRAVLAILALPLVACVPDPYSVTQHGLVSAPRPATYDGQPLTTPSRFEAHASTSKVSLNHIENSGAAVTKHQAGGALRHAISRDADVGVEVDGSWGATDKTFSGDDTIGMPDAAVIDGVLALRTSSAVNENVRVGFAFAMGMSSNPIHREGTGAGYSRDESFLARAAVVPSYRMDNITLYGSAGVSTQSGIPEQFEVTPDSSGDNDPGVVSSVRSVVLTLAAGATIDVGPRTHLNAQIGESVGADAKFGPQVLAGLAFDLGDAPAR